jgi:NADPH:quinone reductase-like Zn-dependent oxidoreductase
VDRIPLADGAGEVEAIGAGVTQFRPGDSVVSTFFPQWLGEQPVNGDFATVPGDGVDGYACERVVRPATWFTHVPRGWSAAQSSTLTTAGVTAWRALVGDGGLKAGDTVLIPGTGGVAILALQIAKAMGAGVILTSSSDEKLTRARALGADHTLNYRSVPEWGAEVVKLTSGRGVDHVLELGGSGTLPQSITACRIGGQIPDRYAHRYQGRGAHGCGDAQADPLTGTDRGQSHPAAATGERHEHHRHPSRH